MKNKKIILAFLVLVILAFFSWNIFGEKYFEGGKVESKNAEHFSTVEKNKVETEKKDKNFEEKNTLEKQKEKIYKYSGLRHSLVWWDKARRRPF